MEAKEADEFEDDLEENEPNKLKYARLTNDVSSILTKDSASCLAAHQKFICLGTGYGVIHLLDHQGNAVRDVQGNVKESQGSADKSPKRIFKNHTVAVNMLSIDEKGDFVASCSDDGFVYVTGLHTPNNNSETNLRRLVKSVAIDPIFDKSGHQRFMTGEERLLLHEKFLLTRKFTPIKSVEGCVGNISWFGQFVAFSSDIGVRVYDMDNKCSLGLIKWDQKPQAPPNRYRCNFSWVDFNTLLIGWVDIIQVIRLRERSNEEMKLVRDKPKIVAEPISKYQVDFYISGIAPLYEDTSEADTYNPNSLNIVLLGIPKDLDESGKSKRPILQIIQPDGKDYREVAPYDELSLRGFENYNCNDYHLESVPQENQFFIVSPKDIVVASPLDADDRVEWYIKHKQYQQALKAVVKAQRYKKLEVGRAYLDHLIEEEKYDDAGKLCAEILGKDRKLWNEEIYKFAKIHQLRSVSRHLPIGDHCLEPLIYEMVLYEFLKMDVPGFLKLIKDWPPTLYNVPAVVNAVFEHVLVQSDNALLLECLAVLYSHNKSYDKAVSVYLKLGHKDAFQLIHKHKLYSYVPNMVEGLMQLDSEQAVSLFLEKNSVPPDEVVSKLQGNRYFLYLYLDALDKKDMKSDIARQYHRQLVELYADYAPKYLLSFLRRSNNYPIQEAFNICEKKCMYPEMVFLLDRMGRTKQALTLMTDELKDIEQATEFCKQQDDKELWEELISKSLDKPHYLTFLLQNIGTAIDPRFLVKRIAPGVKIPGLKCSLGKMMKDYGLQVTVEEGCKKILAADCFNLHARLLNTQQRGICVDDEPICGACNSKTIHRGSTSSNLVVFYCRHVFHEQCLTSFDQCLICHKRDSVKIF